MKLPFFETKLKLKESEKLMVIESLSIMLHAGIPILKALDSIAEDATNKKTEAVVRGLSSGVSSGKTLSEAMKTFSDAFDPVLINLVRSGEVSGNLEEVLSQVAQNLKDNIETASNIKSALFYPALIMVVLVAVAFYVFAFALPKVADIFLEMNMNLPVYSRFILKSSLFFKKFYLLIALFFVGLAAVAVRVFSVTKFRRAFLSFLTKVPFFKALIKFMDLYRFTNTASQLLSSGVPIIEVLDISKGVVVSPKLHMDIEMVREELTQGLNMSESMRKRQESFPSLLRQVVAIGEETGNLEQALGDISKYYGKKFTDIIKNITVLIEPVLLVVVGVLVGLVLVSIIAPIYQGIGNLSPREGL